MCDQKGEETDHRTVSKQNYNCNAATRTTTYVRMYVHTYMQIAVLTLIALEASTTTLTAINPSSLTLKSSSFTASVL